VVVVVIDDCSDVDILGDRKLVAGSAACSSMCGGGILRADACLFADANRRLVAVDWTVFVHEVGASAHEYLAASPGNGAIDN